MAFGTTHVRHCQWVHPHPGICGRRCSLEKGHSRPKISRPILETQNIKPVTLVGILLVILGALALAYRGRNPLILLTLKAVWICPVMQPRREEGLDKSVEGYPQVQTYEIPIIKRSKSKKEISPWAHLIQCRCLES